MCVCLSVCLWGEGGGVFVFQFSERSFSKLRINANLFVNSFTARSDKIKTILALDTKLYTDLEPTEISSL